MSGRAASLPLVFIDRSLGRIAVPQLLRAGGVGLITLAEHYGVQAARIEKLSIK
jgi:hypothetical protein